MTGHKGADAAEAGGDGPVASARAGGIPADAWPGLALTGIPRAADLWPRLATCNSWA